MKILTRQQQQATLDFVCEQYAVALRSYKRGVLKINTFAVIQTQAYNAAEAVQAREVYRPSGQDRPTSKRTRSNGIEKEARMKCKHICNAAGYIFAAAGTVAFAYATVRCPYGEEEEIICDVYPEIVEDFRKSNGGIVMRKIDIRIINKSGYDLPEYKTEQSVGCDLVAVLDTPVKLFPLDRVFINTKVSVALPEGYEAQVRGRSGLNKENTNTINNFFKHGSTFHFAPLHHQGGLVGMC